MTEFIVAGITAKVAAEGGATVERELRYLHGGLRHLLLDRFWSNLHQRQPPPDQRWARRRICHNIHGRWESACITAMRRRRSRS